MLCSTRNLRVVPQACRRTLPPLWLQSAQRGEVHLSGKQSVLSLAAARHLSSSSGAPNKGKHPVDDGHSKSEGTGDRVTETASSQREQGDTKAEHPAETWGDKLFLVGAFMRVAAMLPRFAGSARFLRFAGTGPMIAGAIITVYEIGGWKLVVAIPVAIAAGAAASTASDSRFERQFKESLVAELQEGCPEVPQDVLEALVSSAGKQYETNRMRIEVQWPTNGGEAPQWRCEVLAKRSSFLQSWSPTLISVSRAVVDRQGYAGGLPPQTRNWDTRAPPVTWQPYWSK